MSLQGNLISEEYNNVLTPVLTIKTPDRKTTIMEQSFDKLYDTSISKTAMKISTGISKTAQLTLDFRDSLDLYNSHIFFKGCRVEVKAKKKHQNKFVNMFSGLIVNDSLTESNSRRNTYTITANSMRHIWTHTVIDYEKSIPFRNLQENSFNLKNDDINYYIGNIYYDIFTNPNILANQNGYTLQERGNFTLNGIDKKIPLSISQLSFTGYASELISQLQDFGGLLVGVDEDNDVFVRAPVYKSLGHVIKLNDAGVLTDDPNLTIIAEDGVSRGSSIEPSNYAEVIIGKAFDSTIILNNSNTNSYASLYNKDLAQQIDLRSTKINDLTLIISKVGAGSDSPDPENTNVVGFIVSDNDNKIGNKIIAEFSIPLRSIPTSAEPMRMNIKYRDTGDIDTTKKYWLVIMEIGGGEDNTILWWHDAGKAASQGAATFAAQRDLPLGRGNRDAYNPYGWKIIRNGPVFSHTFTTKTPILHVSKTITTQAKYIDPAPVESIQNPSSIQDNKTMQQYLGLYNELSSRIPIPFDFPKLSIPDIPLRVGYSIIYVDSMGVENLVNITDIDYSFTSGSGDTPFGTSIFSASGAGYELSKEYFNDALIRQQYYCLPQ